VLSKQILDRGPRESISAPSHDPVKNLDDLFSVDALIRLDYQAPAREVIYNLSLDAPGKPACDSLGR